MTAKPKKTIEVEKGKTLYTVDGFTDFFNWMCAFVFNFSEIGNDAESGIEVDCTVPDKPKIKVRYV